MRLKQLRQKKGYKSASALAKAAGCSRNNVSRWEKGLDYPSTCHLLKLVELLGKDVLCCFQVGLQTHDPR